MHEKGNKSRFELYPTKQNQYFVHSTVLFEDLLHTRACIIYWRTIMNILAKYRETLVMIQTKSFSLRCSYNEGNCPINK